MNSIIQWCNENQGVIAAIAILIVVVPAILGLIPKCIKYIVIIVISQATSRYSTVYGTMRVIE